MKRGSPPPPEWVQGVSRHQIISAKEIYYPRGSGGSAAKAKQARAKLKTTSNKQTNIKPLLEFLRGKGRVRTRVSR